MLGDFLGDLLSFALSGFLVFYCTDSKKIQKSYKKLLRVHYEMP